MSRQRGRREPPKPDQEAYIESLKMTRRERARQRARQRAEEAGITRGPMVVTVRRRWAAVAGGTFFVVFAFGALLTSIVEQDAGNTVNARVAMILSAFLALFSLGVLGVVSRGPRPFRAIFATGPAAIGVFLLLGALLREPATPLVAAFGLAAAFTLRPAPGGETRLRVVYVLIGSAIVGFGYLFSPEASVTLAPLMPYFLPMIADLSATRRTGVPMEEVIGMAEEDGEE